MKKINISALYGAIGLSTGFILGVKKQKHVQAKKTAYAGTLTCSKDSNDSKVSLYLVLDVDPEELSRASTVIFNVNTIETK